MVRFFAVALLSSVAMCQVSLADTKSAGKSGTPSVPTPERVVTVLPDVPPLPAGKSTVIGGSIRDIDTVRDQFTLKAFGGQTMRVLFDERTQVYRDGVITPLHNLRPEDHASVMTALDGTSIFALSIHILSKSPEGECQGQVLNYKSRTRMLTIISSLSHEQVELSVPKDTQIVLIGQARQVQEVSTSAYFVSVDSGSFDFVRGALISVKFISDNRGHGIAKQIAILATPGSEFVYSGNVIFLDLHSDLLVLVDPRDDKSYKIFFDPSRFPVSVDLREGVHVKVTTNFDGVRYIASAITAN